MLLQGPVGEYVELFKKKHKKVPQMLGVVALTERNITSLSFQNICTFQLELTRLTGGNVCLHTDFVLGFTCSRCQMTV